MTTAIRWFLIIAPAVAGVVLMIFGTAGTISTAFGVTLIVIALMLWLWNWFIRMSFLETLAPRPHPPAAADPPEDVASVPPGLPRTERPRRAAAPRPQSPARPPHTPPRLTRRPRRPS
ncbi:hypothetical protein [Conexibacter sp. DBS9H8]|uniref:hypothetical protein n=1 Tax=Conexibacter sp. DBS9H8 TaxID=2937801 RepID=UPI00200BF2F0|nr:hypothetical protein [Conexibacter sp. DBS9H8]